jgi:hypothetical protein
MPNTTRQEALEHIDTIDMSQAWAGVGRRTTGEAQSEVQERGFVELHSEY